MFVVHCVFTVLITLALWGFQFFRLPRLRAVEAEVLISFSRKEQDTITYIVLPLMVFEALTGWLLWWSGETSSIGEWVATFLLIAGWLVTFGLIYPPWKELAFEPQSNSVDRVIRWSWLRTVIWSVRLCFLAITVL